MGRNAMRKEDVDPAVALALTLTALSDAARYGNAGMRTLVRRARRTRTLTRLRARNRAAWSLRQAGFARQSLRGSALTPAQYLTAGVLAGMTGTLMLMALTRSLLRWADDPGPAADVPLGTAEQREAAAKATTRRAVPSRSAGAARPLTLLKQVTAEPVEPSASDDSPDARAAEAGPGRRPEPSGDESPVRRV
jgi:hypothetical protein